MLPPDKARHINKSALKIQTSVTFTEKNEQKRAGAKSTNGSQMAWSLIRDYRNSYSKSDDSRNSIFSWAWASEGLLLKPSREYNFLIWQPPPASEGLFLEPSLEYNLLIWESLPWETIPLCLYQTSLRRYRTRWQPVWIP